MTRAFIWIGLVVVAIVVVLDWASIKYANATDCTSGCTASSVCTGGSVDTCVGCSNCGDGTYLRYLHTAVSAADSGSQTISRRDISCFVTSPCTYGSVRTTEVCVIGTCVLPAPLLTCQYCVRGGDTVHTFPHCTTTGCDQGG